MLLVTLGAILLQNLSADKEVMRAGEWKVRACSRFLRPPHRLTNFEIQKYYENEPQCSLFKQ